MSSTTPATWSTEAPVEGTDTVQSSISYTLGNNVENLTLTGSGNINGTGNALANVLIGNSGNNSLDGGTGADTMIGGAGNDIYVVDDVGDVVTELLNEGTDTVQSSISYTLGANVENLTLTGSANFNGTGNALDNIIIGNIGDNVLTGGLGNDTLDGGAGADTMVGGTGNDTYIVDVAGDVVTEAPTKAPTRCSPSIAYTLGANVENLTLTGSGNINGTGNELANVITGNSGNNMLDGGTGADTAVYTTTLALADVVFNAPAGTWTVTGGSAGGNDTLSGIEFIQHAGGRFVLIDPDVAHGGFVDLQAAIDAGAFYAARRHDPVRHGAHGSTRHRAEHGRRSRLHHSVQCGHHGQGHRHRHRACHHRFRRRLHRHRFRRRHDPHRRRQRHRPGWRRRRRDRRRTGRRR